MEKSWEIEKMFNDDIRDKKRTGRGVHYRTGKGSDKARVAGGVRFAKNNFKKYEKNSRVKSGNLYENVIKFDSFSTYDKEMQKEMLEEWNENYTFSQISKGMEVTRNYLSKLFESFNINVESGDIMRANSEEMQHYKDDKIGVNTFRRLPADQKYELASHYQEVKGLRNEDIAKLFGFKNVSSFNSMKSTWKKEWEKQHTEGVDNEMSSRNNIWIQGVEEDEEVPVKKREVVDNVAKKEDKKESPVNPKEDHRNSNTFELSFSGTYTYEQLRDKYEAVSTLLDSDKKYRVTMIIEEK